MPKCLFKKLQLCHNKKSFTHTYVLKYFTIYQTNLLWFHILGVTESIQDNDIFVFHLKLQRKDKFNWVFPEENDISFNHFIK